MARDPDRAYLNSVIGPELTTLIFYDDDVPTEEVNHVEEQRDQDEDAAETEDQNLVNFIADGLMEEAQEEPTHQGQINIQAVHQESVVATNDDDQERETGNSPVEEEEGVNHEEGVAYASDQENIAPAEDLEREAEEEEVNHEEGVVYASQESAPAQEGIAASDQESARAQENIAPAEDLSMTPTRTKSAKKREKMRRKKEKQLQDERRRILLCYIWTMVTSLLITSLIMFILWFFSIY